MKKTKLFFALAILLISFSNISAQSKVSKFEKEKTAISKSLMILMSLQPMQNSISISISLRMNLLLSELTRKKSGIKMSLKNGQNRFSTKAQPGISPL